MHGAAYPWLDNGCSAIAQWEAAITPEIVKTEIVEDHIAVVMIDNPPVNAVNAQYHVEMAWTMDTLSERDDVRAVVLTGAGKIFCAGADLKSGKDEPPELADRWQHSRRGRESLYCIMECTKPVVGAINGPALGAGMGITSMCDVILCSERATFGLPEIDVGLMGGGRHSQRLFGHSQLRRMMLCGHRYTGADLYRLGIVEACVPHETLMAEALAVARVLAAKSPIAMKIAKRALNAIEHMTIRDGYRFEQNMTAELTQTEDATEAVAAFIEKRRPAFKGR